MPNPLTTKLGHFTRLSPADREALDLLSRLNVREIPFGVDIIREGDRPDNVNLILSGWACRYKILEDGRKQIVNFFLPGDLCDLIMFIFKQMDHSIGSLTPLKYCEISRDVILDLTERGSRLSQAIWWSSLVSEAIEREWIVNLGQRSALERLGHLFCELFYRLRIVGLTKGTSFELPLTQSELGDAMGISSVHVNRSVQELRAKRLIVWQGKTITIPDLDRLKTIALFNSNYLHLDHDGQSLDANDANEGRPKLFV